MPFLSELPFFSLLQYSPRGTAPVSLTSDAVCKAVKTDSFIGSHTQPFRVIEEAAKRTESKLDEFPFLRQCFGPDVALVPMPRSTPLRDRNALWPGRRICEELQKQGLGQLVLPVLKRIRAVQKAATAGPGERPGPTEHYESTQISKQGLFVPARITLVDDVITQGSSFIGLFRRVSEAYPEAKIHCFALIRTMSGQEVETILAPVAGTITYLHGQLHREP